MKEVWSDKKRTLFGMPLSFTQYALNEDRLLIRTGVFTKLENEIRLYRIVHVKLCQTLSQRINGVGTIHCCSPGASIKEFSLENVKNPREVRELLSVMIDFQRERKGVYAMESLLRLLRGGSMVGRAFEDRPL